MDRMETPRFVQRVVLILVFLFLMTSVVLANAGSPLLFPVAVLHLVIGNIVIGVIEAFFVQATFKVRVRYGVIVLGNYVSMAVGLIVIGGFHVHIVPAYDFDYISSVPIMLPIVLFAASVFVEWPFFARAVNVEMQTFSKRSFKYSFYAQCVSYAIIIPFYFVVAVFEGGGITPRDLVDLDLNNLAAQAYQYRIRPHSMHGGEGSYEGFSIPQKLSVTENARYSATVSKDSIVLVAMSLERTETIVTVVVDSTGRLIPWKWKEK